MDKLCKSPRSASGFQYEDRHPQIAEGLALRLDFTALSLVGKVSFPEAWERSVVPRPAQTPSQGVSLSVTGREPALVKPEQKSLLPNLSVWRVCTFCFCNISVKHFPTLRETCISVLVLCRPKNSSHWNVMDRVRVDEEGNCRPEWGVSSTGLACVGEWTRVWNTCVVVWTVFPPVGGGASSHLIPNCFFNW